MEDDKKEIDKPFKVSDKRFWKKREEGEPIEETKEPEYPSFLEELKAQKEESERKLLEYIQAFKKMQTEQEEFRERLKRDVEKKILAGKRELFLKLLDMMDNLDRAIGSARNIDSAGGILDGVIMSRDLFLDILKREGVERMNLLGKPFDPQYAEAVMVQEVNDAEKSNLILEEIAPGYTFNGQTLRPAKAKVSKLIVRKEEGSEAKN